MQKIKHRAIEAVLSTGFLISPSRWLAEAARSLNLGDPRRVLVVNNPVCIHTFSPSVRDSARQDLGLAENEFCVLFVAASLAHWQKGIASGIEAVNDAARARPLTVLLVGASGDDIGARVRAKRVIRIGRIEQKERLAQLYAAADVFLLPSVAENAPLTILEAMASGTPTVAFGVGGVPEQIVSEVTGLVVPVGDIRAMTDAITAIADSERMREKMRVAARQRAVDCYSMERFWQRHLAVYAAAISGAPLVGEDWQ
jgi:glycosyltransferase involved in cell wall biosynthesis